VNIKYIIVLTFLFRFLETNAQTVISGKVFNAANEPLAFVDVSVVEKINFGTTTDIEGNYKLKLYEGAYTLVFSFVGFETIKIPVIVKKKTITQNVVLNQEISEIYSIKVNSKKNDKSEEIIKNVIDNKNKFLYQKAYSVEAYIKANETFNVKVKKRDDSTLKNDTVINKNFGFAEIFLKTFFDSPNKIKEERLGVKIIGDKSSLFYLSHTEGDFNFYKNLIKVPALSESPFLSPISNSGLIAYKFKSIKVYEENGQKLYKIKVSPGILGNALFSGEITIIDSIWAIKSLRLTAPKYHLSEYDFFEIYQEFTLDSGQSILQKQVFNYSSGKGLNKKDGSTTVLYNKPVLNIAVGKKFFNSELSSTKQDAYERDSNYWIDIRKEPLNRSEVDLIRQNDSIIALVTQKSYQDSVDEVTNKITFTKLFFFGQTNYKRSTQRNWYFKPLIFIYTPLYIAGPRLNYWVSYNKIFKNKKEINFLVRPNYGFLNKDIKGSASFSKLYNPFSRARYSFSVGEDFGIINPFESWIRTFARSNFFTQTFASVSHKQELVNGLYFQIGAEVASRRSVANYKFDSRGDSLWGGNSNVVDFKDFNAFYGNFTLSYVPFQKYIREPFQKLVLGSKWPEFYVKYRKGLPAFKSTINFDYLEFGVEQELKVGLLGNSKYRITSGEFINTKDLRIIDYKFQRSIGPIFFSNPLYSFQGLDSSFSVRKRYLEAHYFHRFNGSIINKIPIIKKLNLIEVVGGGFLYTQERNLKYVEVFVGFEKIIRVLKERIKIGIFVVGAQSNLFQYQPQLKFTIEVYDKVANQWPY